MVFFMICFICGEGVLSCTSVRVYAPENQKQDISIASSEMYIFQRRLPFFRARTRMKVCEIEAEMLVWGDV